MTITQQDFDELALALTMSKKRTIAITVNYNGGDESLKSSYCLKYYGENVEVADGKVDCKGNTGNKIVLHFTPMPGLNVADVSFRDPSSPDSFKFIVGELNHGGCVDTDDTAEFVKAIMKGNSERVDVVNKKIDSDKKLGYAFKLWITIAGQGKAPVGVEFDPRIINI